MERGTAAGLCKRGYTFLLALSFSAIFEHINIPHPLSVLASPQSQRCFTPCSCPLDTVLMSGTSPRYVHVYTHSDVYF